jgi:hypothetical protein
MRFWVYDEDGFLLRKFSYIEETELFVRDGCTLVVQPKPQRVVPTAEQYEEARW